MPTIIRSGDSINDHSAPSEREPASPEGDIYGSRATPVGSFGKVLRGVRETRKLKQSQFATLINQSVSYVSLLESDKRRATDQVLTNLKTALTLTAEEERALTTAANLPHPKVQSIDHELASLDASADLDELQRALIEEDLMQLREGYARLREAQQALNATDFRRARQLFTDLTNGPVAAALSPTIRALAGVALANVALNQGDPDGARDAIAAARRLLKFDLPAVALPLHAEAEAMEGMIDLRVGEYINAATHLAFALDLYRNVSINTKYNPAVAAVGLTKSYNRRALLALLMGKPAAAKSFYDLALHELLQVSPDPNDLTDRRRLRLLALRAWAYALNKRYDQARDERQRILAAYTKLSDDFGITKSHLYMADDARLEIQSAVEPHDERPPAIAEERVKLYGERLRDPWISGLVEQAKSDYVWAISGFEKIGEALLLSRAYRGFGDMLRYLALRDQKQAAKYFEESRRALQRARVHEEKARQGRLIPGAIESLAKVEWDEGRYGPAQDLLTHALRELETSPATLDSSASHEDIAARDQRERLTRALELVSSRIPSPPSTGKRVASARPPTPDPKWKRLHSKLADIVFHALEGSDTLEPRRSALSYSWTELLNVLDQRPGGRWLAQGGLSTSNEKHPLSGLPFATDARATDLHTARYYACEARIRDANESHPDEAYWDICVRSDVQTSLASSGATDNHAHLRATDVLRRLSAYPEGYHLFVIDEALPIHFLYKEGIALVELTPEASALDHRLSRYCPDPAIDPNQHPEMCYEFHEPDFVREVRGIFDDMRTLAQHSPYSPGWINDWLTGLLGNAGGAARASAVPAW